MSDLKTIITISLTSIYDNMSILKPTLESMLVQTRKPDRILLYLSTDAYLLDKGFKDKVIPAWLSGMTGVTVRWVPNTGPFRKLLPALEEVWVSSASSASVGEKHIIITIDDDTVYAPTLVEKMVERYNKTGFSVGCRCTFVGDPRVNEYITKPVAKEDDLYNFATGKGAVLYTADMFRPVAGVFGKEYLKLCPTGDDMWFNLWRMRNGIPLSVLTGYNYMARDLTSKNTALYHNYNEAANKKAFRDTADFVYGLA